MRKKQAKNGHLNENRKFCDENGRLLLNSTLLFKIVVKAKKRLTIIQIDGKIILLIIMQILCIVINSIFICKK